MMMISISNKELSKDRDMVQQSCSYEYLSDVAAVMDVSVVQ